jgi:hypothetical protein
MERTIIETEEYTIVETDNCLLEEIVEIVVKENYLHHQKSLPENSRRSLFQREISKHLACRRFAIAMSNCKSEVFIFKILVYCTVYPIINNCNNVMLAELDMRLFFILKKW